jgi:DNA repair protein SbcC/Rad50
MRLGPSAAHAVAASAVIAEKARFQRLLDADAADGRALAEAQESLRQGDGRIASIDSELATVEGASDELVNALTAVASHIQGEECPVCGRDFSEVSDVPLSAHVSEEISHLLAAVGRVQALLRDRMSTTTAVAETRRREAELFARRLPLERANELRVDLALLSEWSNSLSGLKDEATAGTRLITESVSAAQRLSKLSSQQTSVSGLRAQLIGYAHQLGMRDLQDGVPLSEVASSLIKEIARQEQALGVVKATGVTALEMLEHFVRLSQDVANAVRRFEEADSTTADLTARRSEAERRIALARHLASRAQTLRTEKVRQVFNEELNSVWRELFIRLAPDEDFVPAFALLSSPTSAVEALLETHYRKGGKGGNPRDMLSAGNLNTAALTLFLALHLSVRPLLPWLIIDDPVQSMDDVSSPAPSTIALGSQTCCGCSGTRSGSFLENRPSTSVFRYPRRTNSFAMS